LIGAVIFTSGATQPVKEVIKKIVKNKRIKIVVIKVLIMKPA
jgi:transcription antitermination factor NusG